MGLFDRPTSDGFDRMFDINHDGVLDPSEMDAQECFLHDVNTFDEIDYDGVDYDDDLFLDDDEDDDDFDDEDDDEDDDEEDDIDWEADTSPVRGHYNRKKYYVNEAALDKELYPEDYFTNRRGEIIPRPMNWKFFFEYFVQLDEEEYIKFISQIKTFGPSSEVAEFAGITFYKEAGKYLLERATEAGVVFSLKEVADMGRIHGEEMAMKLFDKTLEAGGQLVFSDLEYLVGKISENAFDSMVKKWVAAGQSFTRDDLFMIESEVSEKAFGQAVKAAQRSGVKLTPNDADEFISYLSEDAASEMVEHMLKEGCSFTKEEMSYLNSFVSEATLSHVVLAIIKGGDTFTAEEIPEFAFDINKKALTEAVKTCKDVFTAEMLNDFDGYVTQAVLAEKGAEAGLVYDKWEGFVEE